MRAFVGLPLCNEALAALERAQEALGTGRLVAAENLHVTLAFLADQPVEVLEALHDGLAEIAAPAMALQFSGVAVKGRRVPSLVWAAVEDDPHLAALRHDVRRAARQAGINLRRERFRPHVTLARFGRSHPARRDRLEDWLATHGTFRAGPFSADRMCLYQSNLTPEGPIYQTMAVYRLG